MALLSCRTAASRVAAVGVGPVSVTATTVTATTTRTATTPRTAATLTATPVSVAAACPPAVGVTTVGLARRLRPASPSPAYADVAAAALAVTQLRSTPRPWLPARRPERIERNGADLIPADRLAAEHWPVHAGPRHPGDSV